MKAVLTYGNLSHTLYSQANNPTTGIIPFKKCCSEMGSSWNGTFTITLTKFAYAAELSVSILVPGNTKRLPVADYFQLVPVSLVCGGVVDSCKIGKIDKISCRPINVQPTELPGFTYWQQFSKNQAGIDVPLLAYPALPLLATLIWTSEIPDGYTHSSEGFGSQSLQLPSGEMNPSCALQYSNIYDPSNENAVTTDNSWVNKEVICNSTNFRNHRDAFLNILRIAFQENSAVTDISSTYALLDVAATYPSSRTWQSCLELSLSFLDTTEKEYERNLTCQYPKGSDAAGNDPCCNVTLQNTKCCITPVQNFSFTDYSYSIDVTEPKLAAQCVTPDCVHEPLKALADLYTYELKSSCSAERIKAEGDIRFTGNPFDMCKAKSSFVACILGSDSSCKVIDDASVCLENGNCLVPCEKDGNCFNGVCTSDPTFGYICTGASRDPSVQLKAFVDCVQANIDPFLWALVQGRITSSSNNTDETFEEKFLALSSVGACLFPSGALWADPTYSKITKEQCEGSLGFCRWRGCYINTVSPFGYNCSVEWCNNTNPTSDWGQPFCAYEYTSTAFVEPYGRPDICQFRSSDTGITVTSKLAGNKSLCEDVFGGVWAATNPVSIRLYGSCYTRDKSEQSCFNVDYCIPQLYNGLPCYSYCSIGTSPCSGLTASGNVRSYHTWKGRQSGQTLNACIVNFTVPSNKSAFDRCVYDEGGKWYAGREWLTAFATTKEECTQACYLPGSGFARNFTADNCLTPSCSSDSTCTTKACCDASQYCGDTYGCIYPYGTKILGYDCYWNTQNCTQLTNPLSCEQDLRASGYIPPGRYPDPTSCAAAQDICNYGTIKDAVIRKPISQPKGFNLRPKAECEKCGGKIQPLWNWQTGGTWSSPRFMADLSWIIKNVTYPSWRPLLSATAFQKLLDEARAARLATILLQESICTYGIEAPLIDLVSCACAGDASPDDDHCSQALISPSGINVLIATPCNTVDAVSTTGTLIINTTDFAIAEEKGKPPCLGISVFLYPYSQLNYLAKSVASSLAIRSETRKLRHSSIYVYNDQDTIVGSLVADGYSLSFYQNDQRNFTNVEICLELLSVDEVMAKGGWKLREPIFEWDVAFVPTTNDTNFRFQPMKLHIPLNSSRACFPLTETGTYFPIGLIEDWHTYDVYDSWAQEEKGLIIFCTIMFLLVIVWAAFNLIERMRTETFRKKVLPIPEIALFSVVVLASLCVTNLLMTLTGSYSDDHLDPLLFDLPALCLLTCVTCIICTWHTIIQAGQKVTNEHQTRFSQAIPFLLLIPLYAAFIGLLVASQATSHEDSYTCAIPESDRDALTVSQKLSITYKAIFAFYAVVLLAWFCYYALLLFHMLQKFWAALKVALIKNTVASVSILASLMIIVAITLYTTTQSLENTTILGFTLAVLMQPCYAITYLYSYQSSFTAKLMSWTKSSPGASSKKQSKVSSLSVPRSGDTTK